MSRRRKAIWLGSILLALAGGIGGYYWYWQSHAIDRKVCQLVYEAAGYPDTKLEKRLRSMKLDFLIREKPKLRPASEISKDFYEIRQAAVPALISLLDDSDENVRFIAALTIAAFGESIWHYNLSKEKMICNITAPRGELLDSRALEPFIKLLLHDSSDKVRFAVANGLRRLKDARSIESLIQVLKDSPALARNNSSGRWRDEDCIFIEVVQALGNFRDARAVDVLIKALKYANQYHDTRIDSSVITIIDVESDDSYLNFQSAVRSLSAVALGKIGDSRAVEPLFYAMLNDEDNSVRANAAKALGEIGDMRAFEPLIQAMRTDTKWYVKVYSVEALAKLGDPRAIIAIEETLRDTTYTGGHDEEFRQMFDKAIAKLKSATTQPGRSATLPVQTQPAGGK